jgi:ribonuclease P protein component
MRRTGSLTSTADFRRTYASGRRASTKTVVAHVLDTGEPRPARVGVSATRGLGGSVQRNRAKRRLREAIRRIRSSMRPGVDAVFVATAETAQVTFQELVDSVTSTASKAGALDA